MVRCIELGADDYLPKPFNPVVLRARVNALLERKRLQDEEIRKTAPATATGKSAAKADETSKKAP